MAPFSRSYYFLFGILFLYFDGSYLKRLYQPRIFNQISASSLKETPSSLSSSSLPSNNKKLVCYYTNWSQYRPKEGKYVPEDIDPFLCTHIIFSFGWMKANKLTSFDSTDETLNNKKGTYERVVDIKKKNPNLKVLLAVGGWSFGTERFKTMSSNRYNRQVFIFSALDYLRQRNFDGLDLDWEFPKGSDDKKNFVDLLKELREAFESEAKEKNLPRLLLSVAVSAGAETIKGGYNVAGVASNVDFINIMSYDFHGKWEPKTGHNAPLYALSTETDWRKQLTMEYGVKMWEKMGAPKEKIVVGLATYGRSFTLTSTGNSGFNAPTSGGGKAGEYTRESGFLAFYEICEMLKNGAKYIWDDEQKVPYAVQGDQWVGFDDERSIREKVQWINENDYGGAMVWTVDMDDFKGTCAGRKYPLIGLMAEELFGKPKQKSNFDLIIQKAMMADPSSKVFVPSTDINMIIDKPKVTSTAPTIMKPARSGNDTNARIVCYFTNWSHKRPGQGQFTPEHLDPFLCTHVIYAFANLNQDFKLIPSEPSDEVANGLYERVLALKSKNPKLKILIAVGGWMMGPLPFKTLTESSYRQTLFTFNVVEFLRKKGFDGLDLCWEFPRGPEDKERYTKLIREIRETFDGESKGSGKPRLLLSAAVPASFEAVNSGYDVPEVNKYLDFINIMTYDFHGDWEKNVNHNSPLFALHTASDYQRKLTVDFSVNEWINKGASREKIVVGLPTYGRSFTLASPNLTDIGDPAVKGGIPGMYTKESGFLSFFEICDMLKMGATLVWDNEQMVPYAYLADQWVGFDDPRSFKVKTQWLKQAGISGIMIWSIDMDDFSGSCMGQKFPLINSAKDELKGYYVDNLDETGNDNSASLGGKSENKDEVKCDEADGHISYHKDKNDCTMYFMCEGTRRHHMPCPQNLVFNIKENVCDWPENVEECATALLDSEGNTNDKAAN